MVHTIDQRNHERAVGAGGHRATTGHVHAIDAHRRNAVVTRGDVQRATRSHRAAAGAIRQRRLIHSARLVTDDRRTIHSQSETYRRRSAVTVHVRDGVGEAVGPLLTGRWRVSEGAVAVVNRRALARLRGQHHAMSQIDAVRTRRVVGKHVDDDRRVFRRRATVVHRHGKIIDDIDGQGRGSLIPVGVLNRVVEDLLGHVLAVIQGMHVRRIQRELVVTGRGIYPQSPSAIGAVDHPIPIDQLAGLPFIGDADQPAGAVRAERVVVQDIESAVDGDRLEAVSGVRTFEQSALGDGSRGGIGVRDRGVVDETQRFLNRRERKAEPRRLEAAVRRGAATGEIHLHECHATFVTGGRAAGGRAGRGGREQMSGVFTGQNGLLDGVDGGNRLLYARQP